MTIPVTCPNGHRLNAQDGLAGSSLPCPACGELLTVPQLDSGAIAEPKDAGSSDQPLASSSAPAKSTGTRLWISLPLRLTVRLVRGVGLALLLLVVLWFFFVRGNDQSEMVDKLSRIGLAFQMFYDTHRMFAFPRIQDMEVIEPNRRPQPTALSWRVHLLPYLEQQPLYEQFHLDEPWDSPHNLTLIEHMPDVYRLGSNAGPSTRFRILTGPGMLFGQKNPPDFRNITDGTRSTILAVVVGPARATTWTQPDDIILDPANPLAVLGEVSGRYIGTVAVDGRLLMLPADIEASKFLALATPSGKEIIDGDTYRHAFDDSQWLRLPSLLRLLTGE